jgi:hypothetical protein
MFTKKCLFRLLTEEGVCQDLLQNKYRNTKLLSQVKEKTTESQFCRRLIKVKEEFFKRGSFTIWICEETRFWEDTWLGISPLSQIFIPL